MGSDSLKGIGLWNDEKVLETDGGDGCTVNVLTVTNFILSNG